MVQKFRLNCFTGKMDIVEEDIAPPGDVEFLEGDVGGSVGPDGSNVIYIKGGKGVNIEGDPATFTLTVHSTGGFLTWTRVAGTTQAMAIDCGYIPTNGALTTLTLPATAVVGDEIMICGEGAGLWTIAQNAGQSIQHGNLSTTVGVGGSITATHRYNTIWIVCRVANTTWHVMGSTGILNVV